MQRFNGETNYICRFQQLCSDSLLDMILQSIETILAFLNKIYL